MSHNTIEAEQLRALCDREEIRRGLNQFCRGLDRCDHFGAYKGDLSVFVHGQRNRTDLSYEGRPT